ncbi:hypothetical protein EI77_03866 [Prosthecobacter fusiformis]|uniref:SH3 domain-containing protein n=1 Tax=Prosthecobacter fusiformis TaxID=48464 RepID=A0A4R7RME2_9BACT|nr:hypothetical protein [Prosthecobacter fusiformis]TDU66129.1 hypothetical protein EI77_03866 [Prosthecobacter fusiformis]
MKKALLTLLVLSMAILASKAPAQLSSRKSSLLAPEPGTMDVEDLLKRPVMLKVLQESPVYTRSTMEQAIGSMAPGTLVKLVGISDNGYRVRGRARHGDVSGWVRQPDLLSPDPNLVPNLKKLHQRQIEVQALIDAKQIALGMTSEEVHASLGKPNRKSSKVSASGREETLEYIVYDRIPQYNTGFDGLGRPVQTVVYIKVETGSMSVNLKGNVVESIEETKGNPLGTGGVKIVPGPIIFGW